MGTGRYGAKHTSQLPQGVKDITQKIDTSKFKVFTDKAVNGFEYSGSGQDTVNFFNKNSNYNDLISKMSPKEIEAFTYWAEGHFMRGQQFNGFSNMSAEDQRLTRIYDKYLDKSVLNEGIVVSRLSGYELINNGSKTSLSFDELQNKVGTLTTVLGNQSTSAAAEGLTIGSSSKDVTYKFSIPTGTKGAGMWIGDRRINAWGPDQREFLLNRDTVYRCTKVEQSSNGGYIVHLKYEGRTKHNYD